MVSIPKIATRIMEYGSKIVRKSTSKTNPVTVGIKAEPATKVFTDSNNVVLKMEREFTRENGSKYLARVETRTLEDGSKTTTTKIFGAKSDGTYCFGSGDDGLSIYRDKNILRETNGSILGGNRIHINKNYHSTMAMDRKYENLTKEYGVNGTLEHKELRYKQNSRTDEIVATQDRVYQNKPLNNIGAKEMCDIEPSAHTDYKHSLNDRNNYYHFTDEGTNYSRAIEAKKQKELTAKLEQEAKIKAAEDAKILAAKKADQMHRLSTAKLFNLNPSELKVVEKTHSDGSVVRYYFHPETGINKRKPLMKTVDHGILHEEYIYKSPKADYIYYKQIGENRPYILAKKGNYTQISKERDVWDIGKRKYKKANELVQYFNNGEIRYRNSNVDRNEILIPYTKLKNYQEYPELYDKKDFHNGLAVFYETPKEFKYIEKDALENRIDLDDFCTAYKKTS